MSKVRRIYVEKKEPYAIQAKSLKEKIQNYLDIPEVEDVRVLVRYDIENISDEVYKKALTTVFSEPPVDDLYEESFEYDTNDIVFCVEYLPGQFDQRADSAVQCVKFLNENEDPVIKTATTYVLKGEISPLQYVDIVKFCVNPVDSRRTDMEKPETLIMDYEEPADVTILEGFTDADSEKLEEIYKSLGLAMTIKDFEHIQNYFKNTEKRNPTMTEIRVLDTYWSDHCRHTTFQTELTKVVFGEGDYKTPIEYTFNRYKRDRAELYKDRPDKYMCLMDLALMAMRKLKEQGKLSDQEETDEINACSIVIPVDVNGKEEEWLLNFKNETHNHPTEIEPFGGAATCLGGAIRDPLSGRTYVYQAMRVTGAADPTTSMGKTLIGKLPQRKIVTDAAHGYSSYGNQIGLATGLVKEIYHPNYVAKRMEIGAVLGAAPRRAVKRLTSDPGDRIILLGGRTGRDGCGGATGSSKVHDANSLESCGAEVQKGNAPTERKLQRLFRREEVSSLIKKCNDFGAGGVSVAIGELADGLKIDLDKVPKKYAGLDGTELAISESQERMAVVVDKADVEKFLNYANEENLEAVEVAEVTKEPRLVLYWRGKEIVNISREFLDTNGAHQETEVNVVIPNRKVNEKLSFSNPGEVIKHWKHSLSDLNVCSQKGLVEMFDSSIGAGTVLMPYGGKYQLTETQTMVAKIPVLNGKTETVSLMTYGFDPYVSTWSPFHGAVYAVTESVAKIVAAGGDYRKIRFSFQEYFRRMSDDPARWSQPFAALLGAYNAQMGFGLPSIGGKDSMSGTFNDIDVPPTLVSFAVCSGKEKEIITPEFKKPGNKIIKFEICKDDYGIPMYEDVMAMYDDIHDMIREGVIVSAYALDRNGVAAALSKMAFGNKLGVRVAFNIRGEELFEDNLGDIIVEMSADKLERIRGRHIVIGEVTSEAKFSFQGEELMLDNALEKWTGKLNSVFPAKASDEGDKLDTPIYEAKNIYVCKNKIAKPTVFIPVFAGTNCEYDSAKVFQAAGADTIVKVFKNLTPEDIRQSVDMFKENIDKSQIIMFPGGFSAGDEPDGSAKFFATAFRNEVMKEAVMDLLNKRDGLALGICNGFQALIKLGLVPNGEIADQTADSPTLTFNTINRHVSKMVYQKVVSNKSPWLAKAKLGGVYVNPASHGEGRFVANKEWIDKLFENGQVATQYVDIDGNPTMDGEWNVNGSYAAIEGITSPDGRVFGKMVHIERRGDGIAKNIFGEQDMHVFEAGVEYFK